MQQSERLPTWDHTSHAADDSTPGPVQWSAVREAQRLVERHQKLLALEYSRAGWKTAQLIEERMHAIANRLLQRTPYPSLRSLLDQRDLQPDFDVTGHPDLAAVAIMFEYLEALQHPEEPRRAAVSR